MDHFVVFVRFDRKAVQIEKWYNPYPQAKMTFLRVVQITFKIRVVERSAVVNLY